jgi:hypothetical protein
MRLLICRDCRSIEELPDYDGPVEYDVVLDDLSGRHLYPNGERHFGNLATVLDEEWANPVYKQKIVEQIASKTTGMEAEFYATKDTYAEDAAKCFNRHGRPDGSCGEYQDSRKRIGNPTKFGWQALPKVYLCHFCPVHSWVKTQERAQLGMYKEH